MPYAYLEEGVASDVTFCATGRDLEELFTAAADATTNAMVEALDSVRPAVTVPVTIEAEALDLALARFLVEIVFRKDAHRLLLRATDVRVQNVGETVRVAAALRGEAVDPARHALEADVKAVTLHGLRVARTPSGWGAQVTVDV